MGCGADPQSEDGECLPLQAAPVEKPQIVHCDSQYLTDDSAERTVSQDVTPVGVQLVYRQDSFAVDKAIVYSNVYLDDRTIAQLQSIFGKRAKDGLLAGKNILAAIRECGFYHCDAAIMKLMPLITIHEYLDCSYFVRLAICISILGTPDSAARVYFVCADEYCSGTITREQALNAIERLGISRRVAAYELLNEATELLSCQQYVAFVNALLY